VIDKLSSCIRKTNVSVGSDSVIKITYGYMHVTDVASTVIIALMWTVMTTFNCIRTKDV